MNHFYSSSYPVIDGSSHTANGGYGSNPTYVASQAYGHPSGQYATQPLANTDYNGYQGYNQSQNGYVPYPQAATATQPQPVVEYLPLLRKSYGSRPRDTITFTVDGGSSNPYLWQLVQGLVVVDGGADAVFRGSERADCLKTSRIFRLIYVGEGPNHHLNRQELARRLAEHILDIFADGKKELDLGIKKGKLAQALFTHEMRWRFDAVQPACIKLVEINQYGRYWVPVLLIESW
ncbi:hypothetical protein VNI00_002526 [Paramarasmius palmivorus]|uniref:Uncharacterized protein n=1 Tax=Paramarasmius palmivorus TaxID=297713 RepID=A0AAW0DZN9_9AGAR